MLRSAPPQIMLNENLMEPMQFSLGLCVQWGGDKKLSPFGEEAEKAQASTVVANMAHNGRTGAEVMGDQFKDRAESALEPTPVARGSGDLPYMRRGFGSVQARKQPG